MKVIAAPTGSGKTVVLELAILRMLLGSINKQGLFSHIRGSIRAVYLAPSKALVQVHNDLHGKALNLIIWLPGRPRL